MKRWSTVQAFIDSGRAPTSETVAAFEGFASKGDGGASLWVKTGLTGTASQSPINRGDNKLADSSGIEYQPTKGTAFYFDGTNQWFPSPFGDSGAGLYQYNGSGWDYYEEAGGAVSIAVTTGLIANSFAYDVGAALTFSGYSTPGDGGGAQWIKTSDTGTPSQSPVQRGGDTLTDALGYVWRLVASGGVNLLSLGANTASQITDVIDGLEQYGRVYYPKGTTLILDSDVQIVEKGRPDDNTFEVDFSGVNITGSGGFIFDSCKNLIVNGLQCPESHITLRGVWFSEFNSCKTSELRINDSAGTTYTSSYWNTFNNGVFQSIIRGASADPSNAFFFYGVSFRGVSGQGFSGNKDYWLTTKASSGNMQNWVFYGGDISYYQVDVLNINHTNDLELHLNGIYWDSLAPDSSGLLINQWVGVNQGHIAGKFASGSDLSQATKAGQDYKGSSVTSGWTPNAPLNFIPNGDFAQKLDSYLTSHNGPIGSFGGTVTEVEDSEGRYLNMSVGDGDSSFTLCRFRSVPLELTEKYSGALILRNAGSGVRRLSFSVGGQFFDADVKEEWTIVNISALAPISGGSFSEVLMRSTDGLGYNVDVRYIGLVIGTHPPLMCPQHPKAQTADSLRANEVRVGGLTDSFRPRILQGSGSPEGVESAPRGSLYLRNDGGAGTSIYIKESGTGNTGWVGK